MSDRDDEVRRGHPGGQDDPTRDGRAHDEHAPDEPSLESQTSPVDLAAVRADDALLDALSKADPSSAAGERLAGVLLEWRRDVEAEPIGELVDTDTALDLVARSRRPAPRRSNPVLVPFAAAAALLVIAFSGVGLAAKSADMGDPLWGVTRVLYDEHARSVEAATAARTELGRAGAALELGSPAEAAAHLDRARRNLDEVAEAQGHDDLVRRHEVLFSRLEGKPDDDQSAGPPAVPPAESSSPDPSTSTDNSDVVKQDQPSPTTPSEPDTSTSQPSEPSTEPSTPMGQPPDDGSQTGASPTPSGRSAPDPAESGTLNTGAPEGTSPVAEDPSPAPST